LKWIFQKKSEFRQDREFPRSLKVEACSQTIIEFMILMKGAKMSRKNDGMRLVVVGVVSALLLCYGQGAVADFFLGQPVFMDEAINDRGTTNTQGHRLLSNGLKLYFSANRSNGQKRDIRVAERESLDAPWGEAVNLGPNINTPEAETYPTISPDDLELYFWRGGGWRSKRASKDDPWGPASSYTGIYPDEFSADGLTMYFYANWTGGYGGTDIWMATRATRDDEWDYPVNLGPNVNDERDQWVPSISNDGLALFFSIFGSGNYVCFRTTKEDDWGPRIDLALERGFLAISPDGRTLYFESSSRPNSLGLKESFWQAPIKPFVDFTYNGIIDLGDLLAMTEYWGTDHSFYDIGPMPWGDDVVNDVDLEVLMNYYGQAVDYTAETVIDATPPHNPGPSDGYITDVEKALPISWTPGDASTVHDLYLGKDRGAVENANISDTSGIYRGEQFGNSYTPPEGVQSGQTYYWRLDEVRSEDIAKRGEIWSFTVADYLIVDDFESYDDGFDVGTTIWHTWIDGFLTGTTGAQVGYPFPPFAETITVHSGFQAMPFFYDNDGTIFEGDPECEITGVPYYSETQRTWAEPQDWTRNDVGVLSLWFYGDPGNAVEPFYVALEDNAGNRKEVELPDPFRLSVFSLISGASLKKCS
jgi:hypothetical protein